MRYQLGHLASYFVILNTTRDKSEYQQEEKKQAGRKRAVSFKSVSTSQLLIYFRDSRFE